MRNTWADAKGMAMKLKKLVGPLMTSVLSASVFVGLSFAWSRLAPDSYKSYSLSVGIALGVVGVVGWFSADVLFESLKQSGDAWRALDMTGKARYATQLMTTLALLSTVVFGWLGWREANRAREDQLHFFIALNAPDLQVSLIKEDHLFRNQRDFPKGLVALLLKNAGGFPIREIKISTSIAGVYFPPSVDQSELGTYIFTTLEKGGEGALPLFRVGVPIGELHFLPETARIIHPGDQPAPGERYAGEIRIEFTGEFGDMHSVTEEVAMMPTQGGSPRGGETSSGVDGWPLQR